VALLLAARAEAAPGWAKAADAADAQGHTFICEGQGKSEEDALSAAHGICNDKICKVCGVEVESVTETKETLTGVDFQRKVIERCRRVRTGDAKVLYKSTDCAPEGCTAWIQLRYSKEDEQRECPRYAKEDFADPAACEKDIDGFSKVQGRTAESFYTRTRLLDDALVHCDKIDVRPTPALMALDAKLGHGIDNFEFVIGPNDDRYTRPLMAWYLPAYAPLRKEISETKFLTERIQLVRDYVHNKALVCDVIEATVAKDWGTPQGLQRMHAALSKAPVGSQYGASRVHFVGIFEMGHSNVDTSEIGALLRKLYPPDRLDPEDTWNLAVYFSGDKKITEDEWRYMFAVHQRRSCVPCLRVLLEKPDHGSDEARLARFWQAWETIPQKDRDNPKRAFSVFKSLIGYHDPALVLALEPKLPREITDQFDWDYFHEYLSRLNRDTTEAAKAAMVARATRAIAAGPVDESSCMSLADALNRLSKAGGQPGPARDRVCACLAGPLKDKDSYANKSDLVEVAQKSEMKCEAAGR
jgi:hypothetical protein